MRTIHVGLAVWLVLGAAVLAPRGAARAQQAGAFARMGFAARGMALGNALVADRDGGAASYYNPALAAYGDREVEAAFALLRADRELQFIRFRSPLPPRAGIAGGLIHAGVEEIDGRDESGYHTRTYSTDEFAGSVDFGLRFGDRFGAGIGLRVYRSSLVPEIPAANSLGLRAGLLARVTERITAGLVVDDLLAGYQWDSSSLYEQDGTRVSDSFPLRLRLGASGRFVEDDLHLHLAYAPDWVRAEQPVREVRLVGGVPRGVTRMRAVSDWQGSWRAGAEWRAASSFWVRAGISGVRWSAPRPVKPSAGFSIRESVRDLPLRIAYAAVLEPYVSVPVHVVSLRFEL